MNTQSNESKPANNRLDNYDSVTIELFGTARLLAGKNKISITYDNPTHLWELLRKLADIEPKLVGIVISNDRNSLTKSFILNLNGDRFVTDMNEVVVSGDNVLIFSSQSGG
ncbi:MAG: hypothetical protein DK302_000463 [Chloroflexi bacterium]|jgi:molybdopterin converting factor small subunit|nr:MAG: hypothetical protein DK302_000463 [Chloroflexota bacterium]